MPSIAPRVGSLLYLLVAVIHLIPAVGVFSQRRLEGLYGIVLDQPPLLIVTAHRAVLFAIVAGLLMVAAVKPSLRLMGLVVGLTSMLSFVVVAYTYGGGNAQLDRVVFVDVAASVLLVIGYLLGRRRLKPARPGTGNN